MNNLKEYDEFINEGFGDIVYISSVLLGFITGMVLVGGVIVRGPTALRRMKIFINKIKAIKSYRKQSLDILNDLTPEQKKKLKNYIKHSALAKWTSKETFFGIPPEVNITENDPLGEEDWGDDKRRNPVKIGTKIHNNPIEVEHGPLGPQGNYKFNGVDAIGTEVEFFKEEKIKREKESFLNIFNGEQKIKIQKLIDVIDLEFQNQTMRDTKAWGVKDPNVGMSRKPKLDLRPIDLDNTENWWDRKNKEFNPRYDKWGQLKKQYWGKSSYPPGIDWKKQKREDMKKLNIPEEEWEE